MMLGSVFRALRFEPLYTHFTRKLARPVGFAHGAKISEDVIGCLKEGSQLQDECDCAGAIEPRYLYLCGRLLDKHGTPKGAYKTAFLPKAIPVRFLLGLHLETLPTLSTQNNNLAPKAMSGSVPPSKESEGLFQLHLDKQLKASHYGEHRFDLHCLHCWAP